MAARGRTGTAAAAEFELALVEVLLELAPLAVDDGTVFLLRAHRAAPGEVALVVAYDFWGEGSP